jgi:hypothetical protein
MRFPICALIWRAETPERSALTSAIDAVLRRRSRELGPNRSTSWNYFGNHEGLADLGELVRFALTAMKADANQQREAKLQWWLGDQPQLKDEFEFVSMPDVDAEGRTRLLEQWELTVSEGPWLQVELLLWAVTSPTADWCQSHLNFCRIALANELVQAVWNGFQSHDLREAARKRNEYWGLRAFLEEAIPCGALMTDGRTPEQKSKMQRKNITAANAGVVIGRSKTGQEIVAVTDSPESLTAFEQRARLNTRLKTFLASMTLSGRCIARWISRDKVRIAHQFIYLGGQLRFGRH